VRKIINYFRDHPGYAEMSLDDWNLAVRCAFGRYFTSSSQLENHREYLRTDLLSLLQIQGSPGHIDLLARTLRLFRVTLAGQESECLACIHRALILTQKAESAWMSIFHTQEEPHPDASPRDQVAFLFTVLGKMLEECYRPRLQILLDFVLCKIQDPQEAGSLDFGRIVARLSDLLGARAELYLRDPVFNIAVNQWRNIPAHSSYDVVGIDRVEATFGSKPKKQVALTVQQLRDVVRWATHSMIALRLALTVFVFDNMAIVQASQPSIPSLRLDSRLVDLSHNLNVVGFMCQEVRRADGQLVLVLRDRLGRPVRDAIIHASQALVTLSTSINADSIERDVLDRVQVRLLFGERDDHSATAVVRVSDALAYTREELTLAEYIALIAFEVDGTRIDRGPR
jgi:hypothetical protein